MPSFQKFLGILFPSLEDSKKRKTFLGWHRPLLLKCIWKKPHLFANIHLALLRFFPICNTFIIIDQCRFFYFRDVPWQSDDYARRLHYSLFGQSGFCLIFIVSKNKDFLSGALLKTPSFPWKLLAESFAAYLLSWRNVSTYSEIHKFEISNDLHALPSITKPLKKFKFQGEFQLQGDCLHPWIFIIIIV